MRTARVCFVLLLFALLTGCRAHMITIKLVNISASPLSTIIVDYPSATFGKDKLAPGESFSSTVKLTDDGPLKVQFTDANGGNHAYTGPMLHKSEEGSIDIKFDQNSAVAEAHVSGR
jgi:hypothetical protein